MDSLIFREVAGVGVAEEIRLNRGLGRDAVEGAFGADVLLSEAPDLVLVADKLASEGGLDELDELFKDEAFDLEQLVSTQAGGRKCGNRLLDGDFGLTSWRRWQRVCMQRRLGGSLRLDLRLDAHSLGRSADFAFGWLWQAISLAFPAPWSLRLLASAL